MRCFVSDYGATGEGVTYCMMVTNSHDPKKRFKDIFGEYLSIGLEEVDEKEYLRKYKRLLPKEVKKVIKQELKEPWGCHFMWHSQTHINCS